jgi:hypothetical protein
MATTQPHLAIVSTPSPRCTAIGFGVGGRADDHESEAGTSQPGQSWSDAVTNTNCCQVTRAMVLKSLSSHSMVSR